MKAPAEARDLKDEAAALEIKGQWRKALDRYLALEQVEPDEGAWPRHAGEMCRRLDRTADAAAALARAVKTYARTGFMLKAVAVSKLVLEIDPQRTEVQAELAAVHASPAVAAVIAAAASAIALPPVTASPPAAPRPLPAGAGLEEVSLATTVPGAIPSPHLPGPNAAGVYEIPLAGNGPAANPEAARATLGRTPLFSSLDERRLLLLIERTHLRRVSRGQVLFKIGDPPDGLYVVAAGEVAVSSAARGQEVEVDRLGEGSFFGEAALLTSQPRTVTVRATADSELLVIDREAIGAMVADSPMVLMVLLRFMRDRMVKTIVETNRLFAPLRPADRLFLEGRFRFLEVEAGATLVEQGKCAPGLFVVLCGEVEAQQDGKRLVQLGPGRTFGEASLLGHRPAASTIRALRKCFLLMLPLAAFQEVTLTYPQVLELIPPNADDW